MNTGETQKLNFDIRDSVFVLLKAALYPEIEEYKFNSEELIKKFQATPELFAYVFHEMRLQTVSALPSNLFRKEFFNAGVEQERYAHAARFFRISYLQQELIQILKSKGIPVVILKGFAAAFYYPYPELRSMGDIDALVNLNDHSAACEALIDKGYVRNNIQNEEYHTTFFKDNICVELHHAPAGIDRGSAGDYIRSEMKIGLQNIEWHEVQGEMIPMLPWKQNGIEFIWHIREHLYNGLGLRQIIDWMMYADAELTEERYYTEFQETLKRMGLVRLAAAVTRMCQLYLGLRSEGFSWCEDVEEDTCRELLDYIMGQGNFGIKTGNTEKTAKVLSGYKTHEAVMTRLQKKGLVHHPHLANIPVIRRIVWLPESIRMLRETVFRQGIGETIRNIRISKKRKKLFVKLYD